ncbi:hypothetical protein VSR68_29890 [Paraburkholderia phymatum]|uniref:hypothetical protein n=1 Tax=Paraburkholderia phymatum TaxID=148447 RepID=UPI00316DDCF9
MKGVSVKEVRPGFLEIKILSSAYGEAGAHWMRTLSPPENGGYGRIFIQRFGANKRRYWHCYGPKDWYKGESGINQDECPGAMFVWTSGKYASVEAVDAIHNQSLGRDLGLALSAYPQQDENDLWEVTFRFDWP